MRLAVGLHLVLLLRLVTVGIATILANTVVVAIFIGAVVISIFVGTVVPHWTVAISPRLVKLLIATLLHLRVYILLGHSHFLVLMLLFLSFNEVLQEFVDKLVLFVV